MRITTRTAFVDAQRDADRAITALFRQLIERVTGILAGYAGPDGAIDLADSERALQQVANTVESMFVRRVTAASLTEHRAFLEVLIAAAREQLNAAPSEAARTRARARILLLGDRLQTLNNTGAMLAAFRGTEALTPYARILKVGTETVTRTNVLTHAGTMMRLVGDDAQLASWLQTARALDDRAVQLLKSQGSVLTWADTRGYQLSDRIWSVGTSTRARIDALLRDGIAEGRSAVDLARDLKQFLLPSRQGVVTRTPYGTVGSFDARRLARTEITRAWGVSNYIAGVTNPFVTRTRWYLSTRHDPANCDGTCDAIYAEDQANGGFDPASAPIPVVDTHPQCTCGTYHETGDADAVLDALRADIATVEGTAARSAPITPLASDLLIAALLWGFQHVTSAAMTGE